MNAAAGGRPAFPWRQVMVAAFGLLRLSPKTFWAMTPVELDCALEAVTGRRAAAPGQSELAALMRLFPDESSGEGNGRTC